MYPDHTISINGNAHCWVASPKILHALYEPKTGVLMKDLAFFSRKSEILELLSLTKVDPEYFATLTSEVVICDIICKCYSVKDGVNYTHATYYSKRSGFPRFCLYRQMVDGLGNPIRFEDVQDKELGYTFLSLTGEVKVTHKFLGFHIPLFVSVYFCNNGYYNGQWFCEQHKILPLALARPGIDFSYFPNGGNSFKCIVKDDGVYLQYDIRPVYMKR